MIHTVGRPARFRRGRGLQAQKTRELVLQLKLGRAARAELLIQLDERPLVHLLTERDRRPQIPRLRRRRRDFEEIQIERLANGFAERRGDEAGGDAARGRRERGALTGAELVDGTVEDDERQDVAFLERRSARQLELRRAWSAGDMDARFDAGARDLPRCGDVEDRVD